MTLDTLDQFVREIRLDRDTLPESDRYPFSLEAVRQLEVLKLHPKVTFLVGENGTGKSTVLEAVAAAFGLNPESGSRNLRFATQETHSELYRHLRLVKGVRRASDSFFLRAESFYNLATKIEELDRDPDSFGPRLIDAYGGVSLHEQSHGESFLSLFMNWFRGKGFYILDEPEAALSPTRQLSLLARMHELVRRDSQFLIATHSPILMAYPDAVIYELKEGYTPVAYRQTEHYQVTREFLNNTGPMLDILFDQS